MGDNVGEAIDMNDEMRFTSDLLLSEYRRNIKCLFNAPLKRGPVALKRFEIHKL